MNELLLCQFVGMPHWAENWLIKRCNHKTSLTGQNNCSAAKLYFLIGANKVTLHCTEHSRYSSFICTFVVYSVLELPTHAENQIHTQIQTQLNMHGCHSVTF